MLQGALLSRALQTNVCGPGMSAMERGHEGQMQKVTVTEDQVLGEASQECSRHDQFRLGVVRSQIKERTPASCSSPGVARPSPGQEETGSRS